MQIKIAFGAIFVYRWDFSRAEPQEQNRWREHKTHRMAFGTINIDRINWLRVEKFTTRRCKCGEIRYTYMPQKQ